MSAGFSDTYQDILSGSDRRHFLHRRSSGRIRFPDVRAPYFAGQRLGRVRRPPTDHQQHRKYKKIYISQKRRDIFPSILGIIMLLDSFGFHIPNWFSFLYHRLHRRLLFLEVKKA